MGLYYALLFVCGVLWSARGQLDASSCLYRKKGLIWNIGDLTGDTDYKVVDPNDPTKTIEFNICKQVEDKCQEESYAVLRKGESCIPLTNSDNSPKVTEVNNEDLVLTYKYTGDLACDEDPSQKYSFQLKLICKSSELAPRYVESTPCNEKVEWAHPKGCPWIKANALWNYFHKYKVYLAPSVILLGLFYLLLGGYFKRISIFLITFASVVFIVLALIYGVILSYKTPEWAGWIVLTGAVVLGLIAAFFLATFIKTGVILIGLWAGGLLGATLYELVRINDHEYMLWLYICILALISAILSLKFLNLILIIGTSFIGGFLFIRGIAFYTGGYPNEFQLHNEIQAGDYENVPFTVYVYVACMFLTAGLAVWFKHKKFRVFSGSGNGQKDGYYAIRG